jgi:hypothetical protein
MKNITDLLQALVMVIIHYHHSKPHALEWIDIGSEEDAQTPKTLGSGSENTSSSLSPEASLDLHLANLLTLSSTDLEAALLARIDETTHHFPARKPLLLYLLFNIRILHDSRKPGDADDFIDSSSPNLVAQAAIVTLFETLRTLSYECNHYQSITLQYDDPPNSIQLFGFVLSRSTLATQIQKFILQPFDITATENTRTLRLHVECLFLRQYKASSSTITRALLQENSTLKEERTFLLSENTRLTLYKTQKAPVFSLFNGFRGLGVQLNSLIPALDENESEKSETPKKGKSSISPAASFGYHDWDN